MIETMNWTFFLSKFKKYRHYYYIIVHRHGDILTFVYGSVNHYCTGGLHWPNFFK